MNCDRCCKKFDESNKEGWLDLYIGENEVDLLCKLCPGCQKDFHMFMGFRKRVEQFEEEGDFKTFIVTADGIGGMAISEIVSATDEDEAWDVVMETACQAKSNDFSCERMEEVERG